MADSYSNRWKLTTIALLLVGATALTTGLVTAHYSGSRSDQPKTGAPASAAQPPAAPAATARTAHDAASAPVRRSAAARPTAAVVERCNEQAKAEVGQQNKTLEVVKDSLIGAAVGAAVGAAGGAVVDGGSGAGKGAAIGGIVGGGGGALYGINENRTHDERYRSAYRSCLQARGYGV